MGKLKLNLKRPELSFDEVMEQYDGVKEDDLFHAAAQGELTIYFKGDGRKVGMVCSFKQIVKSMFPEMNVPMNQEDFDAMFPELKEFENEADFAEKIEKALERSYAAFTNTVPDSEFQEVVSNGLMSFYPNNGIYRAVYMVPLIGLQPISALSVAMHRNGVGQLGVFLKMQKTLGIGEDSTDEFVVIPDPKTDDFISFEDARRDGLLFLMKDELLELSSNKPIDPDDVKPKGGVSRKTLLKLVIGMAMNRYHYDPKKGYSDTPKTIEIGINSLGIDITDDTIRKALKEAKEKIL